MKDYMKNSKPKSSADARDPMAPKGKCGPAQPPKMGKEFDFDRKYPVKGK